MVDCRRRTTVSFGKMLRTANLGTLLSATAATQRTTCALEFVRYHRKPRWVPVAKSKMFRVPERKRQDADEQAELKRLHNNYKTQMRSVLLYFREEVQRNAEVSTADHYVLTPEQEEAEFQKSLEVNEAWNKSSAAARELRLTKEREERAVLIRQRLDAARERDEERIERVEALVRREKDRAKTYITREKLDEAIAYALANPVDYNFALDLQGNMYRGRNATAPSGSPGSTTEGADIKQLEARN